jgi:LacI family transcriptional regulator
MVTLQDIATAADVSLMTVSRCLRNDPRHSAATRERVRAVADRLGYVPNPLISTLMAQLRQKQAKADGSVIALVAYYPKAALRFSATWQRLEAGIRERAAQLGFGCDWFALEDYPGERGLTRFRKVLLSRRINAAILFPMPNPNYELAFDPSGFALAALGTSLIQPRVHHVSHHHYDALRTAAAAMHLRGYRRIALAVPKNFDANVGQQWLAALSVQPAWNGAKNDEFCHYCGTPPAADNTAERKRFLAWVRSAQPDLIFGLHPCDQWWREELRDRRKQIDYAALDLSPSDSDLAGIDQMSEHLGASAVDMVVAQLHRNETGLPPYQKVLHAESHWREGPSLRRPIA